MSNLKDYVIITKTGDVYCELGMCDTKICFNEVVGCKEKCPLWQLFLKFHVRKLEEHVKKITQLDKILNYPSIEEDE